MTILIVEDDVTLRETLAYNLQKQGYAVEAAGDGRDGLEAARRLGAALELVLLDLMLPKLDGFEVCRILRSEKITIPILMLTARDDEIDRVVGLEIGADDYISKPFSMRELMARIKAHLRHDRRLRDETPLPPPNDTLVFGNLVLNLTRREVLLNTRPLALKPQEYELLVFMAQHRGQALTRDRLLEQVWGWDFGGGTRTVDVHIRWLREKIEPDPENPARIITVRGAGYRFEG